MQVLKFILFPFKQILTHLPAGALQLHFHIIVPIPMLVRITMMLLHIMR
jgi:hypothetical protein